MAETNRRVSSAHSKARKALEAEKQALARASATKEQIFPYVIEVLWQEIAELSHRYLRALDAIHQEADPDSDEFAQLWAEIDVSLFTMQLKIKDVLKEMERLEDTWPD